MALRRDYWNCLTKCLQCNNYFKKNYYLSQKNWLKQKFCSRQCHNLFRQGKPSPSPATTFQVGHRIYVPPESRKRGEDNNLWKGGRVLIVCQICKKEFEVDRYRKDTAKTCSKECLNKYRALPKVRIKLSKIQRIIAKEKNKNVAFKVLKSFDKLVRISVHYKLWRDKIFKRDNYICRKCNANGYLIAHHKKQFAQILYDNNIKNLDDAINCKELWSLNNGISLCRKCHRKTHNYGQKLKI